MEIVKQKLAQAAVDWLLPQLQEKPLTLGVGSGTTVNCLIDALGDNPGLVNAVIAASVESEDRLKNRNIAILPPEQMQQLDIYIDGADFIDPQLCAIKGGGGALTREKILASQAQYFVCLCDHSKVVPNLQGCPIPLEIIDFARTSLCRWFEQHQATATVRPNYLTNNGHPVIDVTGFDLSPSIATSEQQLCALPGIIECGLFAVNRPHLLITTRPPPTAGQIHHENDIQVEYQTRTQAPDYFAQPPPH
ncbi:MAG: ribose 5-phosphate isomerase A [Gammaproteobacteria bacterium]